MHAGSTGQPGKSGGWSTTCKMITQQPKKGNFQVSFPESGYYTVQFGITQPAGTDPATGDQSLQLSSAYATITWKVEGNYVTRKVSVGNGTVLSGTGQACSVVVEDNTPNVGGLQSPGFPYDVNVQISKGSRPSQNQPPTYLQYPSTVSPTLQSQIAVAIAPSTSPGFQVPVDIGVISLNLAAYAENGGTRTTPDLEVTFLAASTAFEFKTYYYSDANAAQFVPVPPGATAVRIINLSTTDTAYVTLTWGIEG